MNKYIKELGGIAIISIMLLIFTILGTGCSSSQIDIQGTWDWYLEDEVMSTLVIDESVIDWNGWYEAQYSIDDEYLTWDLDSMDIHVKMPYRLEDDGTKLILVESEDGLVIETIFYKRME